MNVNIEIPIKEVYTRIKATAESGVGYNYSPKVVDTKSEYFMTATLANIGADKTAELFNIIPYWRIMVCTICFLAMPLGLSTIVVPGGYGKDTSVAAGMAIVSHLLSAVTIPIIFYIMMNIL